MKENDPVAAYFDKLPETHKRQFEERASGANFNFQQRLRLACELGGASSGRLLDCAAGTGEITCALLKSGKFNHATVVDVSPAMLQSRAGLRILETRRHSLGVPFGDRFWPWANFQLETRLEKWASRHGADAIYLLGAG